MNSLLSRSLAIIHSLDRTSSRLWIAIVVFLSIAQRLALLLLYSPVSYGDTPSYRRLAEAFLKGWEYYDGTRTPGYPIFLGLLGSDEHVWLAQMVLGLVITLLFYYMGWQLTGRAWFGGMAALAHTLNLGQLFFEPNLLSETLTTFWVTLTLAGIFFWLYHPQRRHPFLAAVLGLVSFLALITRPLFIYLPFWALLFIAIFKKSKGEKGLITLRVNVAAAAAFLLPVVLLLGGWVRFIHNQFGDWGLTTMTGYHLIQHTGLFFELVPDEYADLRDTYIKFRDDQISRRGNQANAIWDAIPEMQRVSGHNFYDLSRILAGISVDLILDNPHLYLLNVAKGWWYFWRVPVYWSSEALLWDGLAAPLKALILGERLALIAANLLFLVTSLGALVWRRMRETCRIPAALWCLAGSVWFASIIQTLVDHGDNPRFLAPMQSLVVLWVLWLGVEVIRGASVLKQEEDPVAVP